MITNASITAVLPVTDAERAAGFYRDRLQLEDAGREPSGNQLFRTGGGSMIALMPAEEGAQTGHTVLSFEVSGIADAISELEGNGVNFEDYDLPGLKTVDHIASIENSRAAWFHDSEGNVLCLHEVL